MIHVITSNPITVKSIYDYTQNFIICDCSETSYPPYQELGYKVEIYYADGMDTSDFDQYVDENLIRYTQIPIVSIQSAADEIANKLIQEVSAASGTKDVRTGGAPAAENTQLVVACSYQWNHKLVRYIEDKLAAAKVDVDILDIYRYMKFPSDEKLSTYVKAALGTEFIYPDDPVQYSYALMLVVGGVIK